MRELSYEDVLNFIGEEALSEMGIKKEEQDLFKFQLMPDGIAVLKRASNPQAPTSKTQAQQTNPKCFTHAVRYKEPNGTSKEVIITPNSIELDNLVALIEKLFVQGKGLLEITLPVSAEYSCKYRRDLIINFRRNIDSYLENTCKGQYTTKIVVTATSTQDSEERNKKEETKRSETAEHSQEEVKLEIEVVDKNTLRFNTNITTKYELEVGKKYTLDLLGSVKLEEVDECFDFVFGMKSATFTSEMSRHTKQDMQVLKMVNTILSSKVLNEDLPKIILKVPNLGQEWIDNYCLKFEKAFDKLVGFDISPYYILCHKYSND